MNKLLNVLLGDSSKLAAWEKASPVPGFDRSIFRKDRFGSWIKWHEHGKCTVYGWEIDHVTPLSVGGISCDSNQVATHWKNNRLKSNRFIG